MNAMQQGDSFPESLIPALKRRRLLLESEVDPLLLTNFEEILQAVCKNQINFKFRTKREETRFWHHVLYAIGSHMIEMAKELNDDFHDDHLSRIFCGSWVLYTIDDIEHPRGIESLPDGFAHPV